MNTDLLLKIESSRLSLHSELSRNTSARHKVFALQNFIDLLFSSNNPLLIEGYLPEFIEPYKKLLDLFSPEGIDINLSDSIIKQVKSILQIESIKNITGDLENSLHSFQEKTLIIKNALDGIESDDSTRKRFIFPLLSKSTNDDKTVEGYLDTITAHLKPVNTLQKFFTIPDEIEKDELLIKQLRHSWQAAKSFVQEKVKKDNQNFEVFIHFNGSYGVYRGSSLGVVLTLCFIEGLLKFYNSNTVARTASSIVFTGSMDGEGKINSVSTEIIKAKTAAVFYSRAKMFVVPFDDYPAAKQMLDELKILFPKRNLELIPVTNLEDILNRRNIVEIKKLTPVQRGRRFVIQNWAGILTAILLTMVLTYFLALDFDDNPATYSADGRTLYIKNKNGKVLWKKAINFNDYGKTDQRESTINVRILDIDGDGKNEVLLQNEFNQATNYIDNDTLRCYDEEGKVIWRYALNDLVTSKREIIDNRYGVNILDTLTLYGIKCLFLWSANIHSFSSAIYNIDLKTGQRLPGTLWCSGHVVDALLKDINNDGKKDIVAIGYDNGYEDGVLFGYEIDTLTKVRFTTDSYLIRNYPVAELITYLRFPKLDYDNYYEHRSPALVGNTLKYDDQTKHFAFGADNDNEMGRGVVEYWVDDNFIVDDVVITSNFRVRRDTLVAHGKLKPPYTDTEAYKEVIKNNILYYRNGRWVKREEVE